MGYYQVKTEEQKYKDSIRIKKRMEEIMGKFKKGRIIKFDRFNAYPFGKCN